MSSTYGLICLNHDPGIEIGDHTIEYQPETMLAVAKDPAGRDWGEHARCDLVVAAYSYPIVRVGCPGKTVNGAGCRWHEQPMWIERDLLRLLISAYQAGDAVPDWATEPYSSRCWSRERVLRLGPVLGLADPGPHGGPALAMEPPVGAVLECPDGTRYTRIEGQGGRASLWQWRTAKGGTFGVITWRQVCANASDGGRVVEAAE